MKQQWWKWLLVPLAGVGLLLTSCLVGFFVLLERGVRCEEVYGSPEHLSPGGQYMAQVRTRDCGGATTAYTTRVVLTERSSGTSATVLTYPRAGTDILVEWQDANLLIIKRPDPITDWELSHTEMQKRWHNVHIQHVTYRKW